MVVLDGHASLELRAYGMAGVLTRPSPESAEVSLDAGVVLLQAGSTVAFAYPNEFETDDRLLESGYALLQQALDIVSFSSDANLAFSDLVHQHLLYWHDLQKGTVVGWSDCVQSSTRTSVSWTVRHEDGSTEESPVPGQPPWAEGQRYFRKAQNASSAGDAYRDMYLAMEQAMSYAHPHTGGGEGQWTRTALSALIRRGVQVGVYATNDPDPVTAFMTRFYLARNGHSHAKAGKPHRIPHDLATHDAVVKDLSDLGVLVLHAFHVLGWDEQTQGGMLLTGIAALNDGLPMQLFLTDDSTEVTAEDTVISPKGHRVHQMNTVALGKVDPEGFDYGWLGEISLSELSSTEVGRLVATLSDAESLFAAGNPPRLQLASADVFQYRLVHAQANVFGRVRRHYPS